MKDQNKIKRLTPFTIFSAMAFLFNTPLVAADSNWELSADIYLWAPQMTATTPGGDETTLPFYNILDDLKMGFMGAARAQNDRWSISADAIYLKLDQKVNVDSNYNEIPVDISGDIGLKGWIVTPTVGYAVHDTGDARIEIVGGARYLWLKASAKVEFDDVPVFNESDSAGYWDAIIGARATFKLNDKWFVPMYFDIGTGDTDRTWQGFAGVGYRFEKLSAILGYRYLDYKFDDSNPVLADLTVKGPIAGIMFNF